MPNVIYKKNKRAKNISIRIQSDGLVRVTIPRFGTLSSAKKFVQQKRDWIEKHIQKASNRGVPLSKTRIEELRRQAKQYLPSRTRELSEKFHLPFNNLTIRHQKSRWGSCSAKNNINLNCELMRLPPELCDYVILHELAHTKQKNHQKPFWDLLESICPGAKKIDKSLKSFKIGFEN